jgi:hypothetical protein
LNRNRFSHQDTAVARLLRAVTLCIALTSGGACTHQSAPSYPNGMTHDEFEIAEKLIAHDTTWRVAGAGDSRNQRLIVELRRTDPGYQPYFCRSSVSQPVTSFSFVLARTDTFRVIYVRVERGSQAVVDEVAQMTWLDDGQITCVDDGIEVAPFNSDEVLSFRWNQDHRKLELLNEESSEPSEPS